MPLDIALGIFLSLGVAQFFDVALTPLLVALCIGAALFPDLDMPLTYLFGDRSRLARLIGGHRGLFHYPLAYVLPTILIYFLFGPLWTTVFGLGVLLHLIHDTFFLGWGITWLWPFSSRKFRFFPDKDGQITSQLFVTWTEEEEPSLIAAHRNPHWVRDFYFRPSLISFLEYGGLLAAGISLLFYLYR